MNAKDYLEEAKMINVSIKRTVRRIRRIEEMLDVHGVAYDGDMVTSGSSDTTALNVVDLVEKREYLRILERHYLERDDEVEFVISALNDPIEQYVLSLRYQDGLSYKAVGREVGYTGEGARKACERAIKKIDPILIPLLQDYKRVVTSCH